MRQDEAYFVVERIEPGSMAVGYAVMRRFYIDLMPSLRQFEEKLMATTYPYVFMVVCAFLIGQN